MPTEIGREEKTVVWGLSFSVATKPIVIKSKIGHIAFGNLPPELSSMMAVAACNVIAVHGFRYVLDFGDTEIWQGETRPVRAFFYTREPGGLWARHYPADGEVPRRLLDMANETTECATTAMIATWGEQTKIGGDR